MKYHIYSVSKKKLCTLTSRKKVFEFAQMSDFNSTELLLVHTVKDHFFIKCGT